MKNYQFEEITAAISIIIALLSYHFQVTWLYYIYCIKAIIDTACAVYMACKSVRDEFKNL